MVSRSLFEVFLLMRNNALQSRHLYTASNKQSKRHGREPLTEDRIALVSDQDYDNEDYLAEQYGTALRYRRIQNLPPEWVEVVDEVNGQVELIQRKVKELKAVHDKVIRRPAFDDDEADTSRELESMTREITQLFHKCHTRIGAIKQQGSRSRSERRLAENAALRLNRELQEVSIEFKVAQVTYLKQLQARQERSNLFLTTGSVLGDNHSSKPPSSTANASSSLPRSQSSTFKPPNSGNSNILLMYDDSDETVLLTRGAEASGGSGGVIGGMSQSQSYQSVQMQMQTSASNVELVQQRDHEIDRIVRSIEELNSIFKDVTAMISDQGTVLDRIDHNLQEASVRVESAHKQLVKADRLQKTNRKMLIIFVLSGFVVFLIVVLIIVKLSR